MSVNLQLDQTGALVVSAGSAVVVDNVAQRVATRLRMLLGEWFLDLTDGTPYLQQILVQNVQIPQVRSVLQARILATEGVTGIQTLDLTFDRVRRKLSVSLVAFGPSGVFKVAM